MNNFEEFVKAYKWAMLWANCYAEDPENPGHAVALAERMDLDPDISDFTSAAGILMEEECEDFLNYQTNSGTVGDLVQNLHESGVYSWDRAGHDFALTRNGHGAGYWDRGLGDAGDILTEAAHTYGEAWCWLDDDGVITYN